LTAHLVALVDVTTVDPIVTTVDPFVDAPGGAVDAVGARVPDVADDVATESYGLGHELDVTASERRDQSGDTATVEIGI
jgi:hypothetical protein